MSLRRINCFFEELEIPERERVRLVELSERYSANSKGMMHFEDLKALGSALVHRNPQTLFEIGTFRGNTADFCLTLLSELRIVSIAHVAPAIKFFGKSYNNSHKERDEIGCDVREENRGRFSQLYGDSHALAASELVDKYGFFDFVIVDGDHSGHGVAQDTALASKILSPRGAAVCWHDANPKKRYEEVKNFLEMSLPVEAIATRDTFIGGIAFWQGCPEALV